MNETNKKFEELDMPERILALQLFNELLQNEQQKAAQAVQAYNQNYHFWRHFN
jgi:hypothetical protein